LPLGRLEFQLHPYLLVAQCSFTLSNDLFLVVLSGTTKNK